MPDQSALDVDQAAERIGTTSNRVLSLIRNGYLPAVQDPTSPYEWQIQPTDLVEFLTALDEDQ